MVAASLAAPPRVTVCATLPSGLTIIPSKAIRSPSIRASPPMGVRHEPSSTARNARSAESASDVARLVGRLARAEFQQATEVED